MPNTSATLQMLENSLIELQVVNAKLYARMNILRESLQYQCGDTLQSHNHIINIQNHLAQNYKLVFEFITWLGKHRQKGAL